MWRSKENRGSEWKIWDLHIHTPASFHWNDGKKFSNMTPEEEDDVCKRIVEKLNSIEPVAFSVMDYFTFDGIVKLRKYLKKGDAVMLEKT